MTPVITTTCNATIAIFFSKVGSNNDNSQSTQLDDEHNAHNSGNKQINDPTHQRIMSLDVTYENQKKNKNTTHSSYPVGLGPLGHISNTNPSNTTTSTISRQNPPGEQETAIKCYNQVQPQNQNNNLDIGRLMTLSQVSYALSVNTHNDPNLRIHVSIVTSTQESQAQSTSNPLTMTIASRYQLKLSVVLNTK